MGEGATPAELLEAFSVALWSEGGRLVGTCPRCDHELVVDSDRWTCGCGSGGPTELVAIFGGFSMSHASALVRSGWRPEGSGGLVAKSSLRPLPLLCDPDADDETLLDGVLTHYEGERRAAEPVRQWLASLGIDDALADELRIGFSNRTLGYRLPQANRKDGAVLRDRLTTLGIYRTTGHEHFRGRVVVPVLSAERRVLGLSALHAVHAATHPAGNDAGGADIRILPAAGAS